MKEGEDVGPLKGFQHILPWFFFFFSFLFGFSKRLLYHRSVVYVGWWENSRIDPEPVVNSCSRQTQVATGCSRGAKREMG